MPGQYSAPFQADNGNMNRASEALSGLLRAVDEAALAAGRPAPRLLAVSKTQPPEAVAALRPRFRALHEELRRDASARAAEAVAGLASR